MIFKKSKKKLIKKSLNIFLSELFRYNKNDSCFDPIGSIDKVAMFGLIDSIVDGSMCGIFHVTSIDKLDHY